MNALLKQFSVEVCSHSPAPSKNGTASQDYINSYKDILKDIGSRMSKTRN